MIWDLDIPQDSLQAYVSAVEGIHSYIQDTKVALSDRMKCNNGVFNEHKVCQADEDGSHIPTETAFVYISTWDLRLEALEGAQKTGTLHYITEPADKKGLYTVNNDNEMVRAVVKSHSALTGLLEVNAHADILLNTGGNAMAVDLHLIDDGELIITNYGTDDGNPLNPAHLDLSWYDAHGDDSIDERHIPDGHFTISDGRINADTWLSTGSVSCHTFTDGLAKLYGWPKFTGGSVIYGWGMRIRLSKATGVSVRLGPAEGTVYMFYSDVREGSAI